MGEPETRRYKNRGAKLLALRMDRMKLSQVDIASELGCASAAVSRWLSGERTPLYSKRALMFDKYNIPMSAWEPPR